MKKILVSTIIALLLLIVQAGMGQIALAAAEDQLGQPAATPIGIFGSIAYVQYDGTFEGRTSTGAYRVPYRIIAPADPRQGNRTVLVEPSHFVEGLGTLETKLGRDFLLTCGFAHAGIGWSTTSYGEGFNFRILDPTVPGVFINGGFDEDGGRTDDEIIVDFARALAVDPVARQILGRVDRRYLTGLSDSTGPILRLLTSGRASGVFDLALPYIAAFNGWEGYDPQSAISVGRYVGKLIIVNSESEGISANYVDRGSSPDRYRFYAVAGTPHIPDPLVPFFSNMTSPASYQPALRAHFLQGDTWVKRGTPPLPSTHLKTSDGMTLDRDANGNAISVNARGQAVPRLPFIELGEARFTEDGFLGSYDNVKTITDLGFRSHDQYVKAFTTKLADYLNAGYILREDADAMRRRAQLCDSLTFTGTYRDVYENFVAIEPCNQ